MLIQVELTVTSTSFGIFFSTRTKREYSFLVQIRLKIGEMVVCTKSKSAKSRAKYLCVNFYPFQVDLDYWYSVYILYTYIVKI